MCLTYKWLQEGQSLLWPHGVGHAVCVRRCLIRPLGILKAVRVLLYQLQASFSV